MTNDDSYIVNSLSLITFDKLMVDKAINDDHISLEGGLFGVVKELGGKISNFFSGLFKRIKALLNISEMINSYWESGIDKDVINSIKTFKKLSSDLEYNDIALLEIPVTMGLRTKALPLMTFLEKESASFVKRYMVFMEQFDTDLSEFISIEDFRTRFSSNNDDKEEKYLQKFNGELISLLNVKQYGAKATFDDLYGSRSALDDSLNMSAKIYKSISEKEFKKATLLIRDVKPKLDALYDLIEIEKEPVSKAALRSIINRVELASDYTTILGKLGLLIYETSKQSVDTVAIIKAIKDNG